MRDPVGIALRCQDAGARVVALHARTRTQMYTGLANWDEIAKVAEALDIPVLGNGDIKTAEDAYRMYQHTRCDGIMIGRGSFGQPWIFKQTRALLDGTTPMPTPSVETRFAVALDHARRNQSAMAVVYLDLDGFKQVNTTLGHGAGDGLLKMVAVDRDHALSDTQRQRRSFDKLRTSGC